LSSIINHEYFINYFLCFFTSIWVLWAASVGKKFV
jgi:hypothetical protein